MNGYQGPQVQPTLLGLGSAKLWYLLANWFELNLCFPLTSGCSSEETCTADSKLQAVYREIIITHYPGRSDPKGDWPCPLSSDRQKHLRQVGVTWLVLKMHMTTIILSRNTLLYIHLLCCTPSLNITLIVFQSLHGYSIISDPDPRNKPEWYIWHIYIRLHPGEEIAWKFGLSYRSVENEWNIWSFFIC